MHCRHEREGKLLRRALSSSLSGCCWVLGIVRALTSPCLLPRDHAVADTKKKAASTKRQLRLPSSSQAPQKRIVNGLERRQ